MIVKSSSASLNTMVPDTDQAHAHLPVPAQHHHQLRRESCHLAGQLAGYQNNYQEENSSFFYCSMFFFILSSFICGIVLTVVGGANITRYPGSCLPIWMMVEGLAICVMLAIIFSGDTDRYTKLRMIGALGIFVFVTIWSVIGIIWSYRDGSTNQHLAIFSSIISILCIVFNIIGGVCWVYWMLNALPCSEKKIRQTAAVGPCQTDHVLNILDE